MFRSWDDVKSMLEKYGYEILQFADYVVIVDRRSLHIFYEGNNLQKFEEWLSDWSFYPNMEQRLTECLLNIKKRYEKR